MYEDYKHPDLTYSSGWSAELDIFIPSLHLAIEYQGAQHYHDVNAWADQRSHAERDQEKRKLCEEVPIVCMISVNLHVQRRITVVEVPYWWDGNKDSLAATIHAVRP